MVLSPISTLLHLSVIPPSNIYSSPQHNKNYHGISLVLPHQHRLARSLLKVYGLCVWTPAVPSQHIQRLQLVSDAAAILLMGASWMMHTVSR